MTTKRYCDGVPLRGINLSRRVKHFGWKAFNGRLWLRNFYEHVIRNEKDLDRIREYIENNPLQWHLDEENPAFSGHDMQCPRT